MSAFTNKLVEYVQARRSKGGGYGRTPIYDLKQSDAKLIEDTANYFGFRAEHLANLINFESGGTFNPAIQNSIGATGLIQFIPSTAISLGTTTYALQKMSFPQQMEYVKKYIYKNYVSRGWIDKNGNPLKNKASQIDLFMIIFYPVSVGNPNYKFPQNVVNANGGTKTPTDYYNKATAAAPFKTLLSGSVSVGDSKIKILPIAITLVALSLVIVAIIKRQSIIKLFNKVGK